MKQLYVLIVSVMLVSKVHAQFTQIPTGTTAGIGEMVQQGDTLIMLGFSGYFAKYCVTTGDITVFPEPGISSYSCSNLQVVQNNYYILSRNLNDAYVLKSVDYGNSWDTLFHTPGKFYTMSIADSTFGILGGFVGCKAVTDGSDTAWVLQDSLVFGDVMSSATYGDSTAVLETTGQSYITQDRGVTWELLSSGFGSPRETGFLNKDTIFSLFGNAESAYSLLTYNGGAWISSVTGQNPCIMDVIPEDYVCYSNAVDVEINSDGSGYILAHLNSIFRFDTWQEEIIDKTSIFYTNDYGINWTSYLTEITDFMFCMKFVNDSTAFLGGENGLLYRWDLTVPLSGQLSTESPDGVELNMFPNPAQDLITVSGIDENSEIFLTDLQGKVIYKTRSKEATTLIDVSSFERGVYLLKVANIRGCVTQKIILQ